ncbi:uncharacterized protein LOC131642645 [Vicia villosa]|uniref:uncharacterized protein LOC131642645 n=1 Tax=Vicia villosa TaxID=3911 RepID=UPI00273C1BD8|nr:uncharacterized protein LOC131642645 [Vicia villosa]
MIREEIKVDCQESDESDEESYVGELTISELAASFTETCLMNENLCAKVREYRSINRFLLEERVSLMIDITDQERKLDKSNVRNDSKSLSESNVIENVLTTSEDIVKLPRSPILLQTANITIGPSRYLLRLNCSDSSHKCDTSYVSKSFKMSQQSCDASPVSDSATPDESSNSNRSLEVVPLRTISSDDVKATKPKIAHAKWPKEGIHDKGAKPSASNTIEELTKKGTRYVDQAITRINTSKAEVAHTSGCDPTEEEIIKNGQGGAENTNVTEDVNDIEENKHTKVNTETGTNVVDLDEYSDDELLASLNPSVANRLMTRRKAKAISQSSPEKNAEAKSTVKDSVKKKSTSAGPIKSRAVAKSVGVGPSKSWSKVVPKKRKEREIVEYEFDVEGDVPNIPLRNKPTTSKLAASIPEIPIDNVSFHYASSASRWKHVLQKRLAVERELAPNALENKEILEPIQEAGLLKTMCNLPKCYERLVKEFMVNLSEDCGNSKSADFIKVFVRGKCVSFSPSVINNFLVRTNEAQPELEVTDNKVCQGITAKQVKSWPLKEKLTASKLSIKYAMLHKIEAANWVSTNHKSTISTVLGRFLYDVGTKAKFDYGTYIFDQTMKHARSFSVKGPIAFPSLLCGIILTQYPNILNEHDVVCKRESPLAFHYKLFQGTHVRDIVMTSVETSKSGASASKAKVIAMLNETCKELEARKISLEKMISTLEMDENEKFADAVEMADEDE